jgi:hypothetical protein
VDDSYLSDKAGNQSAFKTGRGQEHNLEIAPKFSRVSTLVYRDDPKIHKEVDLSASFWTAADRRPFPVVIRGIRLP